MEEGWIDLLITAAVMGGETRGQRLIAGLSDKKPEQGRGGFEGGGRFFTPKRRGTLHFWSNQAVCGRTSTAGGSYPH